jgi:hypothetical protein
VQALRALAVQESEKAIGVAQAALPRDEGYAAAAADGISRLAIRHAFGALSLRTNMDDDGRVVFVRAGEPD